MKSHLVKNRSYIYPTQIFFRVFTKVYCFIEYQQLYNSYERYVGLAPCGMEYGNKYTIVIFNVKNGLVRPYIAKISSSYLFEHVCVCSSVLSYMDVSETCKCTQKLLMMIMKEKQPDSGLYHVVWCSSGYCCPRATLLWEKGSTLVQILFLKFPMDCHASAEKCLKMLQLQQHM